jgi:hypothetical protein
MSNISTDFSTWSTTATSNQPDSSDTATIQSDLQRIQAAMRIIMPNVNAALTPTHTELNYVDGVTSAIQTQLDSKATSGANSNITSLTGVTAINRTGGTSITGTNTNSNASAGHVGEYIESSILIGSAISLTTNVASNVTSISLTAGDWDVSGIVRIHSNSDSTSFTQGLGSIGSTSATVEVVNVNMSTPAVVVLSGVNYCGLGVPTTRISLASTTTIYLVARATFTVSTAQAYGNITARRIR